MSLRTAALVAMGLTAVMVVAGCGGENGDASGPPTVDKLFFVKQANDACARERADLRKGIAEFERRRGGKKPNPYADVVHYVYLPTIEAQIADIELLEIPRGEEARIEAMLDAERRALDSVAVKTRVPSVAVAERQFAAADKLFLAYGLSACANGGAAR